jgi:type IV secretory pathway VirB6-like protein
MNLLSWINQGIDNLTNVSGPGIDALGFHIFVALLTTMMVWFGVQEALASAHGGAGFNFAKFVDFVVLASFAYTFIEFYRTPIPGVGYSFYDFITVGASDVAKIIGADALNQLNQTCVDMQNSAGVSVLKAILNPYYAIVVAIVQVLIAIYSATITVIVAYGSVAAAAIGLLGPLFIPFLLVEKLSFLFWGWLRAFIGFNFYKVVAAAVLSILSHLYQLFYSNLIPLDPATIVTKMPLLIVLIAINVYLLLKIPSITSAIFSGHTGGSGGGGLGIVARLASGF